jgi:hypothetical protein
MGHVRPLGLEQALATARQTGAQKDDAGIDVSGVKNELGGRR